MTPLEAYLAGRPASEPPSLSEIRRHHLGAWCYAASPIASLQCEILRPDYLELANRHQGIKLELLPLLRAWSGSGIRVMPFKGFWMSEAVYTKAGTRFYGDVDLLMRPEQRDAALNIALRAGWTIPGKTPPPYSHGMFNLIKAGGATRIDVHRFPVHSRARWNARQRTIAQAVWSASRRRAWQGSEIHEADATDAFLILVLQRAWGDSWHLKPADMIDLRELIQTYGVTWKDVVTRAAELHCGNTVDLFLQRCDPWHQTLDMRRCTDQEVRRYDRLVFGERPFLQSEIRSLRQLPRLALDLANAPHLLPGIARVARELRNPRPLLELLQSLAAETTTTSSERKRDQTVRRLRHLFKVMSSFGEISCLFRALVIFHELHQQGWPVRFVTGVRRGNNGIQAHAWTELDGSSMPELAIGVRHDYMVMFEYPSNDLQLRLGRSKIEAARRHA
jgi:hypothetical protein